MKKNYWYFENKYWNKFYRLGYNMAAGKKGTGRMIYKKGDFKELKVPGEQDIDVALDYAQHWLKTKPWRQEVGSLIREIAEKEGIKEGTDPFIYDVFQALANAWVSGYQKHIIETESKKVRA